MAVRRGPSPKGLLGLGEPHSLAVTVDRQFMPERHADVVRLLCGAFCDDLSSRLEERSRNNPSSPVARPQPPDRSERQLVAEVPASSNGAVSPPLPPSVHGRYQSLRPRRLDEVLQGGTEPAAADWNMELLQAP